MTLPRNLVIHSTADPVADAAELERAHLHRDRMEANVCPNGCGPMVWDDPHTRHCSVCKFIGWCNTPHTEGQA